MQTVIFCLASSRRMDRYNQEMRRLRQEAPAASAQQLHQAAREKLAAAEKEQGSSRGITKYTMELLCPIF